MSWKDRLLGWLPYAFATIFVAGIAHIIAILIMPLVADRNSYARIAAVAPLHRLVVVPPGDVGSEMLPFEDPATALGICRYDLRSGPVRLRAALTPDQLTLLSFHSRYGRLYYSLTDRSVPRGRLDVTIATQRQLDELEARDSEEELPQDLRILSPTEEGLVVARALAAQPAGLADAKARLSAIACTSEAPSK